VANVISFLNTNFSTTTLSLSLAANTTYQFQFYAVMATSAAATGIFPTLQTSVAPKNIFYNADIPLTASTAFHYVSVVPYGGVTATDGIASMSNVVDIWGSIITLGATNLTFMFRCELAGGKVSYQNGTASATPIP
jgi:hypothetical protein